MGLVHPIRQLSDDGLAHLNDRLLDAGITLSQPLPAENIDYVDLTDWGGAAGCGESHSAGPGPQPPPRLCYWPWGRPPSPLVAVVSSRLGRRLSARTDWFLHLRALCQRSATTRKALLCAPGTTTESFVRRGSQLFCGPCCELEVAPPRESLRQWWQRHLSPGARQGPSGSGLAKADRQLAFRACVSPPLSTGRLRHGEGPLPGADLWCMLLADRVEALYVRPGGRILPLLTERLRRADHRPPSVQLAISQQLTPPPLRDQLLQMGAVGRWLWRARGMSRRAPAPLPSTRSRGARFSQRKGPNVAQMSWRAPAPWDMLTHCTRGSWGPWPDESLEAYLDQWILAAEDADRSAFSTLLHIVRSGRLLGSSRVIRGSSVAISFTSVPLDELPALRTFRAHRGGWDFEPYGICIDRELLQSWGARPVIYAGRDAWQPLPERDRPYFQLAQSTTAGGQVMNWQREREWRLAGHLDLSAVPPDRAVLFVATPAEADALQRESRWPVIWRRWAAGGGGVAGY